MRVLNITEVSIEPTEELVKKTVTLCELIEKRFEKKIKESDVVMRIPRKIAYQRKLMHDIPRALYSISRTGSIFTTYFKYYATVSFIQEWLGMSEKYKVVKVLNEEKDLKRKVKLVLDYIINFAEVNDISRILNLLDYEKIISTTPISYRIYLAYMNRYRRRDKRFKTVETPYVYPGSRIILSGELGCGKTTLAFVSLYAFFRFLDFSHEESIKLTMFFYNNTLYDSVKLLIVADKVAEEGLMIPAVIIDDAAAVMSKYDIVPYLADANTRKLAAAFIKYFQISREGIGCKVIITAPRMAPRGIRETADAVIYGHSFKDTLTYTLWIETTKFLRPMYRPSENTAPPLHTYTVIQNFTGTVHPPLVLPTTVSKELTQKKLEYRRKILNEMLELIRSSEGGRDEEEKS